MSYDPAAAVSWKIHPAIGFARVGNSPSDYTVGSALPARLRDEGDVAELRLPGIKRQAAQFRIHAYDAAGKCLGEVEEDTVKVEWQVTLANRKASGPRIGTAGRPRNPDIAPDERWRLEVTTQPRRVAGLSQRAVFDDGAFMGTSVCLGELRTDDAGRLLVLGGYGKAGTYDATKRIKSATDNDGWYDDVSDGPVSATLTLADGRVVAATPAWVVVTPPGYAPGIRSIATQFDVLMDRAVSLGLRSRPVRPSFRDDILPILRRVVGMEWISRYALERVGALHDLGSEADLAKLGCTDEDSRGARQAVFAELDRSFRHEFTATQLEILRLWSNGAFEPHWTGTADPEEPDRVALDACAGGALFPDPQQIALDDLFMPGEGFRFDHAKLSPGDVTRSMALPWHADVFQKTTPWPSLLCPGEVLTQETMSAVRDLDRQIAGLADGGDAEQLRALRERREALWMTRQPWARGLATAFPAREESLVKEWQHLGFVAPDGADCHVESERGRYVGSMGEYFHRMVNFEENLDFAPKALELAVQMLADAKFGAHERLKPFRYTPEAFDQRLDQIYRDLVDTEMYNPVSWESGEISWDAIVDHDEDDQPMWESRKFHVGRFSDAALRERFRQFAPQNMTDGSWLQNIISAAPMDGVQARLASIWIDEAGGGRPEMNHSNVYAALMHSQNIYLPPVTSRDFIEQDFVQSAFESPVFQLCVGRFPRRFLPEILGMTLYMEWEATPTSTPIANMMVRRGFDPLYYRMHAAIDNIDAGHGALSKEAIKLYLDAKLKEGGDAVVQEHWQRIWRGYVAWATLGNGADEIVERMLLVDKKQIHIGSSLLLNSDIQPAFLRALQAGRVPLARYLHEQLTAPAQLHLAAWTAGETPTEALLTSLRRDINQCLRAGIYHPMRFAGAELSAGTRRLLKLQPKDGADLIDLGRSLLEDAFPGGIARRPPFPDLRQHYASKMADMIRAKTPVGLQSHRRIGWLTEAFKAGAETVMQALLDHGLIDIQHPRDSRLFEKTRFDGPMFKVFSDEDIETIIDWVESLRVGDGAAISPEPSAGAEVGELSIGSGIGDPELVRSERSQPVLSFGEVRRRSGMGSTH